MGGQTNNFFRKSRLWILLVFTAVFLFVVLFNFGKLAFSSQTELSQKAPVLERGSIVDRNGKPLAVQTNFYHFGLSPKALRDNEINSFAQDIAPLIDMKPSEVAAKIRSSQNSSFIYLKKKISSEKYEQLKKIIDEKQYTAAKFDRIPGRVYPENDLASQLIGYMGDDGTGLSGIEYSRQAELAPSTTGPGSSPYGKNVYLTIDANLQYKLEKIAKESMKSTQAESIMILASQAKTGEILSYISLPSANLNAYSQAGISEKIDRPSVTAYEPGSVFKIFSVASFIDCNAFKTDTSFLCDGIFEKTTSLGDRIKITCLDHHGYVTAREALKYSCNDALAQMSELIDTDTFLAKIRLFGFGERTGIELPGETKGIVKTKNDKYWSGRSKATISIGQEISVSALQMLEAASAIANKGQPVQLTVIQKITDKDGNIKYQHQVEQKKRVLKESTANYILSCMETTAKSGTGTRASLSDISIGVKTGTAQMADPINGGYSKTDFLSNCMAIFPVEDPEIILYIVIQKAKGETYAGRIVAPVIAKAADEIIDHLGMNRASAASLSHSGKIQINENKPIILKGRLPDFTGRPKRDILPLLTRDDINIKIKGEGWVVSQNPPAGTPITENMTIELTLE